MMQRLVVALTIALISIAAAACSLSDNSPQPTYRSAPEGTLRVGGIHTLDGFPDDDTIQLEEDARTVRIDTLALVVSAVELHTCRPDQAPDVSPEPGPTRINFNLFDLFIDNAYAHTPGSSTRLGSPIARDLANKGGRARIVGEIAPPLGAYCRLFAVLAPADDDLDNLTGLTTEQLLGHSLLIEGRWRKNDTSDWQHFTLSSDDTVSVGIDAIDPNTGNTPIRFNSPSDVTLALLEPSIRPDTFHNLPTALPNPPASLADSILQRIAHSLRLHQFN